MQQVNFLIRFTSRRTTTSRRRWTLKLFIIILLSLKLLLTCVHFTCLHDFKHLKVPWQNAAALFCFSHKVELCSCILSWGRWRFGFLTSHRTTGHLEIHRETYQLPVRLKALVAVQDVVDPASVSLQRDLPALLTAARTLVLTGRKHQILLPAVFILHHSEMQQRKRSFQTWEEEPVKPLSSDTAEVEQDSLL